MGVCYKLPYNYISKIIIIIIVTMICLGEITREGCDWMSVCTYDPAHYILYPYFILNQLVNLLMACISTHVIFCFKNVDFLQTPDLTCLKILVAIVFF